mmetsp:Transcript_6310/g.17641  ORF Transcript_6310/g.17641 Transcript_6310/m.17641 type:complete len:81 (-) Transcript_6310:285-527(-)
MTAGLATLAFWAAETISTSNSPSEVHGSHGAVDNAQVFRTLLEMMAGFILHKVSLVAVTLQPQLPVEVSTGVKLNKMNEN